MAEDDIDSNHNEGLIAGLETGDLKPAVYEGGFKTWECALDLARLLFVEYSSLVTEGTEDIQVIEV